MNPVRSGHELIAAGRLVLVNGPPARRDKRRIHGICTD